MPKILLQGLKINYVEEGETNPPVIFLHGAGGSYNLWLRQLEALKKWRRVIALDLPGHGASEGDGFETIEQYRDLLLDFLKENGFEQAVLCGHSMGGAIALSLALSHPRQVEALILVGTGARLRVGSQILETLRDDFDTAVKIITKFAYAPDFPQFLLALGESELKQVNPRILEKDFTACNSFDAMPVVKNITVAALIICGQQDLLTPPKYSQYLKEQITGATLAMIEGAGHMVMVEKPALVNEAIADFLITLG